MRRGRRTESRASREARRHFTETVLDRGECEIQQFIPHECGGGCFDACHGLNKQFIKRETHLWPESEALAAIWDPDNALLGCRNGHNLFDAPGHGVPWWKLPARMIEFAERHGWLSRLEREYPASEEIAA